MRSVVLLFLPLLASMITLSAISSAKAKALQQQWNITCMLVFGDSTVDPGNNNRLRTDAKANFLPYGKDFFEGHPTGRFCNGRLATDLIADKLGIAKSIPAFLDPNLQPEQLIHGVSFASASSGYDDLTSSIANVIPFSKQIEYLKHYKIHLSRSVGPTKVKKILDNAVVVVSAGTNDFILNYYLEANRSKQFTVSEYQDYLVAHMSNYIKQIHRLRPMRFVVVGVPPMGCLPIIKTEMNLKTCDANLNSVAKSFNTKLVAELKILKKKLGVKVAFLDDYKVLLDAATNPLKYGFQETSKGCCGSGLIETGELCKDQSTCKDPSKYIYWDSVHPTERMYNIIAEYAIKKVIPELGL